MIEEPVEDISEVATAKTRGFRWELWLGVVLIAGVVVFAVVNWRRDEDLARRYAQAQAAVSAKDWDKAHIVFAGLADYRDANTQAAFAQRQIDSRNSSYSAGLAAVAAANWVSATEAFSTTFAIQPAYKDTTQRFSDAKAALDKQTLSSLIVFRPGGDRPGLYLTANDQHGELRLPGSDSASALTFADPTLGYLIYDVPAATSSSTSGSSGSSVFNSAQAPRKLQLATLGDQSLQTKPLQSPLNAPVQAVGKAGMWQQSGTRLTTWPNTAMYLMYANTIYTDFQTGVTATVSLPGPDWAVLAVDTNHNRLLLGEYIGKDATSVPGTRFYLSGPDGSDPQRIYFVGGTVQSVTFSADGDFLLFRTTRDQSANGSIYLNQLSVLDLRQRTPEALTLAAVMSTNAISANSPLEGFFLPDQPLPQVLVLLANSGSATISVRDILQRRQTVLWKDVQLPDVTWLINNSKILVFRHYKNNQPVYSILDNLPGQR